MFQFIAHRFAQAFVGTNVLHAVKMMAVGVDISAHVVKTAARVLHIADIGGRTAVFQRIGKITVVGIGRTVEEGLPNQVKILVKKIGMVSEVIDLALKSGANQLSSLTYGVTDTEIAKKQARSLAISQAQESANLLAGASGAKLGKVLSISEHSNIAYPRARLLKASAVAANADMALGEATPTPIAGGSSTITITVDAVYQLR